MHFQANDNLPEDLFVNPVWHALRTKYRHFANSTADACRYPADVAPFVAVNPPSADAIRQLHALLAPGESTWLIGEQYPRVPQLTCEETLQCFQMVLPSGLSAPSLTIDIVPLSRANAQEMVALTTLAFPGFFRSLTCEMGSYYGVRCSSGELIAMGGERLQLDDYSEISAVCPHPSFRGQGFAVSTHLALGAQSSSRRARRVASRRPRQSSRGQTLSRNGVPAALQSHATSHISQDSPN
jgi:hypothetical protein